MHNLNECDTYRPLDKITQPDKRGVGVFKTTDLETWRQHIDKRIIPYHSVHEDILINLETIKNLYLYSWFVYRFGVVAHTQMLNTLELSLSIKIKNEGISQIKGLSNKLDKAIKERWFDDTSFTHTPNKNPSKEQSYIIKKGITGIRNSLNHGSSMLFDPLTLLDASQVCLEIINALFRHKKNE